MPFFAAAGTATSGTPRRSTAKIRLVSDAAANAGAVVSTDGPVSIGGPAPLRMFVIVQLRFAVTVTVRLVPGCGPPPQSIVVA